MPAYCQAISTPLAPPHPAPQKRACGGTRRHTLVYTNAPPRLPVTSRRDANDYRPLRLFPLLLLLLPAVSSGVFPQSFKIVPLLLDSERKTAPPFSHILAGVNGSRHTCLRSRADTSFWRPGGVSIALSGKSTKRWLGFRWCRSERARLCMQTRLAHGRNMQKMNVNLLCRFLVRNCRFKYLFLFVFSLP